MLDYVRGQLFMYKTIIIHLLSLFFLFFFDQMVADTACSQSSWYHSLRAIKTIALCKSIQKCWDSWSSSFHCFVKENSFQNFEQISAPVGMCTSNTKKRQIEQEQHPQCWLELSQCSQPQGICVSPCNADWNPCGNSAMLLFWQLRNFSFSYRL